MIKQNNRFEFPTRTYTHICSDNLKREFTKEKQTPLPGKGS